MRLNILDKVHDYLPTIESFACIKVPPPKLWPFWIKGSHCAVHLIRWFSCRTATDVISTELGDLVTAKVPAGYNSKCEELIELQIIVIYIKYWITTIVFSLTFKTFITTWFPYLNMKEQNIKHFNPICWNEARTLSKRNLIFSFFHISIYTTFQKFCILQFVWWVKLSFVLQQLNF